MPIISMFYGIIIRMFADDHNPPHFHVQYQSYEATFDLEGNMTAGSLPRKQTRLVSAWVELHSDELQADWQISQEGEQPHKIDPLR